MIQQLICCIVAVLAVLLFTRFNVDSQKSALVKESDYIAVANIKKIVPLMPPGVCPAKNAYAFRADVETECPIKGAVPKLFIMYSTGMT